MAEVFSQRLDRLNPSTEGRRWVFVPPDQLTDRLGPLSRQDADALGIVLVESLERLRRRPYHRQRIALEWANQRHFALEQAERGVAVRYLRTDGPPSRALGEVVEPLRMMQAAERELRVELAGLVEAGRIEVLPHEGWLTEDGDFEAACRSKKQWRMDAFYRQVRRRTGILMEGGDPVGGRWSFDTENRKAWKGRPEAPAPPEFEADDVVDEVVRQVADLFADHPGTLDAARLPATAEDARRLWTWAREEALPHFGPYEDAMSTRSRTLFHTQISALMNLHRLVPAEILADTLELEIPLSSKEGFVRQVLGWREFVRHVHLETDGFRELPSGRPEVAGTPDAGAMPDHLGSAHALPPAWWGERSGLHCLDTVVEAVWEDGWSHHITRLMILSNLAMLLDLSPRELTDWFWVAYTDAWDWVVEPNVLAMGTFATGDLMTTKPYVSGAAYIHRMSDYCENCAFHPKKNCPITRLYWAFLDRHRERLEGNPRMGMPLRSLEKRSDADRRRDGDVFGKVSERLGRGEALEPGQFEES